MLRDIVDVLGRRIGSSIDFIEEEQAERVIKTALEAARKFLRASIAEVYCLETDEMSDATSTKLERIQRFDRYISVPANEFSGTRRVKKYDPKKPGFWSWVYDNNLPVWIENRNDKTPGGEVPNAASHSKHVPQKYNVTDQSVIGMPIVSLVVIPFEHKVEGSRGLWGFLDIEFRNPTPYNEECYKTLCKLADHIDDIIWKSRAWKVNKAGTKHVVDQFKKWCEDQPDELTMPYKTGFLTRAASLPSALREHIAHSFREARIQFDEVDIKYDHGCLSETRSLNTIAVADREHFGIVDLTRHEQFPNLLVLLGIMTARDKPCLILYNCNHTEEIPSLVHRINGQGGKDGLLHLYRYECVGDVLRFFDPSDNEKLWKDVWRDFHDNGCVRSMAFRMAHDWMKKAE